MKPKNENKIADVSKTPAQLGFTSEGIHAMVDGVIAFLRETQEQGRKDREEQAVADLDKIADEIAAEDAHFALHGYYSWAKKPKRAPQPALKRPKNRPSARQAKPKRGKRTLTSPPTPSKRSKRV